MAAVSPAQFRELVGTPDWRVLATGASARFRTGSFAVGVALVDAIGRLADEANHHPDVDLRYSSVTVRVSTHDAGGALTDRDGDLARRISAAARDLGVVADVEVLQDLSIAIDVVSIEVVRPFWLAVLGYRQFGEDDSIDPSGRLPSVWFQVMDPPRTERSRVHLDVTLPAELVPKRITAALAAGGRLVSEAFAPRWWVLADPEGNEVCLVTDADRD